jgi:hypothetical protein
MQNKTHQYIKHGGTPLEMARYTVQKFASVEMHTSTQLLGYTLQ